MRSLVLLLLTAPAASARAEDSGQQLTGHVRTPFSDGQRSCRIGQCGPSTMTVAIILLLIILYGSSACPRISALVRDRKITQFYHSAWLARDGAPSQINAIAQTTDGYLWFGSARGLFQFDSVQFKLYEPASGDRFPSNNINALMATPDNGLWISFNPYGIGFLKNGRFFLYDQPRFALASFVRDLDGRIWAGTITGLLLFDGSDWTEIGSRWNFAGHRIWTMFVDRSGTLWVATDDTLLFLHRGSNQFQKTGTRVALGVIRIAQAGSGQLWFSQWGHVLKTMDDQGRILKSPTIQVRATNFLFDRDGSLWMVGFSIGIGRLRFPERLANRTENGDDPKLERFTREDGLTDNEVNNVFEDREGNIWVTSSVGVNRFRYSYFIPVKLPPPTTYLTLVTGSSGGFWIGTEVYAPFRRISENESSLKAMPVSARISSVYQESKDTVWWGGRDGIYRQKRDRFDFFRVPRQVPSDWVWELFPDDRNGGLWVSSGDYGLIHFKDGVWTFPPKPEGLPDFGPSASFHETAGRTWLGYRDGRVFLLTREAIRAYSRNDGLDIGRIRVIRGHGSQMFFGGEIGWAVLENGRFTTIRAAGVRAFGAVTGIVEAADGSVWLNEQHGIVYVSPSDILQLAKGPDHIVQPQFFDFLDGLPGAAQTQFRSSTAIETSNGRLWFATDNGPAWVDPAHMLGNTLPPPVIITALNTDSNRYAVSDEIRLPKGTTTVRFEYTALSFSIPERVRFKYMLQGVDQSWHDAGNLREAVYNNLSPGPYEFRVIAANNDGIWNNAGSTISFSIAPRFYQTTWFHLLYVAAFLVLLWAIYQFRISQLRRQFNIGVEARVNERTRIARDLHDTLLQSFQGLTLHFQRARNLLPGRTVEAIQTLDIALDGAEQAIVEGRDAIHDLRSPTTAPKALEEEIRALGEELVAKGADQKEPMEFRIVIEGSASALRPNLHAEVFRIAREALRNAFNHSQGRLIETEMAYTESLFRIRIRDDGKGIDSDERLKAERGGHWGLRGMRERAEHLGGEFGVWSEPGTGTEIELRIPASVAYETVPSQSGFWLFWRRGRSQ
jgi:signal transduction histidine kinase/ligand-binding sensor domain-containing protein